MKDVDIFITKSQYYQLLGLVTASHILEQKDLLLFEAFKEILGEYVSNNWFWEIRSEDDYESKLKKVLKDEKIEVEDK
jgi:hypothetical protein